MKESGEISLSAELVRKGIHLFALVIPVGYYLVPFPISISVLGFCAAVSLAIDISRFNNWPLWRLLSSVLTPIIRDHEIKGGFTGASYILSTSAVTIALFPKEIAIAAITFIIVGDIAAALVGRTWGRHRLVGKKSVEGSLACLMSLILISFFIPGLPTLAGIFGAFTATVAEALSIRIDDNLTVPLTSAVIMLLVMNAMGYEQAVFLAPFK